MVQIKRIVCPVDFSEISRHAFDRALATARSYNGDARRCQPRAARSPRRPRVGCCSHRSLMISAATRAPSSFDEWSAATKAL